MLSGIGRFLPDGGRVEGFKAGDDIEQFFRDGSLAQLVERQLQGGEAFLDVSLCGLHCREAGGVFRGE